MIFPRRLSCRPSRMPWHRSRIKWSKKSMRKMPKMTLRRRKSPRELKAEVCACVCVVRVCVFVFGLVCCRTPLSNNRQSSCFNYTDSNYDDDGPVEGGKPERPNSFHDSPARPSRYLKLVKIARKSWFCKAAIIFGIFRSYFLLLSFVSFSGPTKSSLPPGRPTMGPSRWVIGTQ